MQELDEWSQSTIIDPLYDAIVDGNACDYADVFDELKKAIREKVLESYHNGVKDKQAKRWPRRSK